MFPPVGNAVASVAAESDLSTLVTALTVAELIPTLSGDGPFTIFAPTNAAFAKIDNLDEILADKELLTSILLYHVVGDARYSLGIDQNEKLQTLNGKTVKCSFDEETLRIKKVNDATIE